MRGRRVARIRRVVAQGCVSIDTVRYYERRGILPTVERRASGYRAFPPQAVERIVFVKQLQALGFTLDEVAELLRLVDAQAGTCEAGRPHAVAALKRVEEKIAALDAIRGRLSDLLRGCEGGGCSLEEFGPQVRLSRSRRSPGAQLGSLALGKATHL